ncbi:MAG TPA: hypothetical protein VGI39_19630 [Polyangiaceae bacterium]|jgi:hypothetical protein
MNHPSAVRRFLLVPFASFAVLACSSAPPPSENATQSSQALGTDVQPCPATSYGFVSFANGGTAACPAVQGNGGRWTAHGEGGPKPCTPTTAPPDSNPFICTYDWIPDAKSPDAAPDVAALEAIPNSLISEFPQVDANDDACGDPMLTWPTMLELAGVRCPIGSGGGNGSKGCDICDEGVGMVFQNRLYLPASSTLHTVAVSLHPSGNTQVLTFDGNAGSGRHVGNVVQLTLPPPPPNQHYVQGPALGYGYKPASPSKH